MSELLELGARVALRLSTKRVRECYRSLTGDDAWTVPSGGGAHRIKPYPMGFYPDDPNLYSARGWGCHEHMWPHERWLVRRAAALRALATQSDPLPINRGVK